MVSDTGQAGMRGVGEVGLIGWKEEEVMERVERRWNIIQSSVWVDR